MFAQMVAISDESLIILGGRASPYSDTFKTPIKLIKETSSNWNVEKLEINLFDSSSFPLWRHSSSYDKLSHQIIIFGGIKKKCTISSNVFILNLNMLEWKLVRVINTFCI